MRNPSLLLPCLLLCACSGLEREPAVIGGDSAAAALGAAELEIPRTPYREAAVPVGGSITGAIELVSDVATDTIIRLEEGSDACGTGSMRLTLVQRSGRRVSEVIVWLVDARAGKPLPDTRRFTIASGRCGFEPRVQAAIAGGMLNVMSDDPIDHSTRFMSAANGRTIETVQQHDAGAVVPVETVLGKPGRVLVRSDIHDWMRGWIQVFDHPYFDVTASDGAFRLDEVPPGRYRLVAWHPRLGQLDTILTVKPAANTRVELRF